MEYTIRNDQLTLTADSIGAELHELHTADGLPVLWDAQPVWPRHAPVCFPWCGDMDGWFEDRNCKYIDANGRHGFIRNREHLLQEADDQKIAFRYEWPGNLALWPWAFNFDTVHTLEGNTAVTTCTVENRSGRDMPTQFGFHPALRCPFLPDTKLEEYRVVFENGTVVPLHEHLFDLDSICFPNQSKWVRLEHVASGKYLEVETEGYSYVLLWSKPGIPGFLCIEPWEGYPGPGHDLMARPGTFIMKHGEVRSWRQAIKVCI